VSDNGLTMLSVSFSVYLLALFLGPPVAASAVGLRGALRMAMVESVIIIVGWLIILALFYLLHSDWPARVDRAHPGSGFLVFIFALGMLPASAILLVLIPLQSVAAGASVAALGLGFEKIWKRLHRR
jgi:hypothetical protein